MDARRLQPELQYQFARSGGAGGQNVNKVATKAELRFDVRNSQLLSDEERTILEEKLANKLTTDGELILTHQTERTQLANKEKATALSLACQEGLPAVCFFSFLFFNVC